MTETPMTDSREVILDAAEQIIIQNGYSALSMRELARVSGLAKGTIYHHFRDKQDVCLRVVEREMRRAGDEITAAAEQPADPCRRLRAVIETYFEGVGDRRHLILTAMREIGEEDPEARELFREHMLRLIEPIERIVEDGIREGVFRRVDTELAGLSLLGMMNGFLAHRVLVNDTPIQEDDIEHTVELFIRGLLRQAPNITTDSYIPGGNG